MTPNGDLRALINLAEDIIYLDGFYGGDDAIVADLARRAKEALAQIASSGTP